MIERAVALPPALLAGGIGHNAAEDLRLQLRLFRSNEPFVLVIDPDVPVNEIHVYHGGELVLKIEKAI